MWLASGCDPVLPQLGPSGGSDRAWVALSNVAVLRSGASRIIVILDEGGVAMTGTSTDRRAKLLELATGAGIRLRNVPEQPSDAWLTKAERRSPRPSQPAMCVQLGVERS